MFSFKTLRRKHSLKQILAKYKHQSSCYLTVFREIISKQNDVMLLMMNKLSHHVNDHIYLQNNIKVTVSECHLRIQEKSTGHFLIKNTPLLAIK